MTKMKFSIGTKVKIINKLGIYNDYIDVGMVGKVVNFNKTAPQIGVEFESSIRGHDCNCHAQKKHGWYVDEGNLAIIKDSELVTEREDEMIDATVKYSDGETFVTLADGTTGHAKLMKGDTYNREKGFQIALAKAQIKQKQKVVSALLKQSNALNKEMEKLREKISLIGG